jgi:hypothetical protein
MRCFNQRSMLFPGIETCTLAWLSKITLREKLIMKSVETFHEWLEKALKTEKPANPLKLNSLFTNHS